MSNRPEKKAMREEIRGRMADSGYVILTDYRGLKAGAMTDLRKKLRGTQSRLQVVSNSFLNLAAKDQGWSGAERFMGGPTAMITGSGDVAEVAKVLREFNKVTSLSVIKGGWFGANTLSPADVSEIADTPPRAVLLGKFVCTLAAPMTNLMGVMQQKLASLVYVLKAVADKKTEKA